MPLRIRGDGWTLKIEGLVLTPGGLLLNADIWTQFLQVLTEMPSVPGHSQTLITLITCPLSRLHAYCLDCCSSCSQMTKLPSSGLMGGMLFIFFRISSIKKLFFCIFFFIRCFYVKRFSYFILLMYIKCNIGTQTQNYKLFNSLSDMVQVYFIYAHNHVREVYIFFLFFFIKVDLYETTKKHPVWPWFSPLQ